MCPHDNKKNAFNKNNNNNINAPLMFISNSLVPGSGKPSKCQE